MEQGTNEGGVGSTKRREARKVGERVKSGKESEQPCKWAIEYVG